jgi:hypothetical protein
MRNLGVFYENGYGLPQDYAKAREWFEKAAAKDNADAMFHLATFYEQGYGVPQDYVTAREWYERAAAKDDAEAMYNVGVFHENGFGVPEDYVKAREWYEQAAAKDYSDAMVGLGGIYGSGGYGLPQDYTKAHEWYEKAAAKDNARAKIALEQLPIREAKTAGRYDEALRLQEVFAAKLEAEETSDGKPGPETANALGGVAWYALFAKEFAKAIAAADRAHTLFPNNLTIETNRAHALMFIGHDKEAKALYLAYKGEVLKSNNRLWEQVIADDFAEFRKAGLTRPMMADVEKELGISR